MIDVWFHINENDATMKTKVKFEERELNGLFTFDEEYNSKLSACLSGLSYTFFMIPSDEPIQIHSNYFNLESVIYQINTLGDLLSSHTTLYDPSDKTIIGNLNRSLSSKIVFLKSSLKGREIKVIPRDIVDLDNEEPKLKHEFKFNEFNKMINDYLHNEFGMERIGLKYE